MDWALLPLRRYADFSGRSRRKEYWFFFLFVMVASLVLTALSVMLGGLAANGAGEEAALPFTGMGLLLFGLFFLAILIPSIAVQVRRFHDQDRSGWFVLLNLIPYLGGLIVLVFMCLEGTRGPNRFGADPKAGDAAAG